MPELIVAAEICAGTIVGLPTLILGIRALANLRNTRNLGNGVIVERYPKNAGKESLAAGAIKFTQGGAGQVIARGLDQAEVESFFKKGK